MSHPVQQRYVYERIKSLEQQLSDVRTQLSSHEERIRAMRLDLGENIHNSPNDVHDIHTRLHLLEYKGCCQNNETIDVNHIREMASKCPYLKNNIIGCPFIDNLVEKELTPPPIHPTHIFSSSHSHPNVYAGTTSTMNSMHIPTGVKITLEDAEAMVRALKANRNNSTTLIDEEELNKATQYVKASKLYKSFTGIDPFANPEKMPGCHISDACKQFFPPGCEGV